MKNRNELLMDLINEKTKHLYNLTESQQFGLVTWCYYFDETCKELFVLISMLGHKERFEKNQWEFDKIKEKFEDQINIIRTFPK